MQYLTYEEYIEIGGVLDLAAFNRNIDRACGFVDAVTFCRLRSEKETPKYVKSCIRDLTEYFANNFLTGKVVSSKSQSAGGVSESESYEKKSSDDMARDMLDIVCAYLSTEKDSYGTPLMYRGAMR